MADALASRWHLPRWARESKAKGTGGKTAFGKVHLLKPQTFMNDSGNALRGLRVLTPDDALPDLLIVVDDFAIPAGTFRLRASGSAGGHNGLKSVQARLGTTHYNRLRIGVGPKPAGVDQAEFVLDEVPREDRKLIEAQMDTMCEAVECWCAEGIERAMALYNRTSKSDPDPEP